MGKYLIPLYRNGFLWTKVEVWAYSLEQAQKMVLDQFAATPNIRVGLASRM